MTLALLRKVVEMEREKGYTNSAVLGGLDKFLSRWAPKLQGLLPRQEQLLRFQQLASTSYNSMDRERRARWAQEVLTLVEEAEKRKGASRLLLRPWRKKEGKLEGYPSLDSPLTSLPGVGQRWGVKLCRLGANTFRDLLYLFPRRHNDFSRITPISSLEMGKTETVVASVWEAGERKFGRRLSGVEAVVGDEMGNLRVVWFGQSYLAKTLRSGTRLVLSGKVGIFRGHPVMESPEWEVMEGEELIHTARLVPVYPLTEGLSPRWLRRVMKGVVGAGAPQLTDFLPQQVLSRHSLLPLSEAVRQAHFPDSWEMKDQARRRLAFDELFLLQLGVTRRKLQWQQGKARKIPLDRSLLSRFVSSLPFSLTPSQEKALREILDDLEKDWPMSRLLQGEVGSGKTVVATTALLATAAAGFQGALMVPTEILAEQHYSTVCNLLAKAAGEGWPQGPVTSFPALSVTVGLLTGSQSPGEKEKLRQRVASGEINLAIGTHALIQEEVEFPNLALVVVDEQHRFGVRQRLALRQKSPFLPHLLVMTATPIPRTLALTLYGDLNISLIPELPPGRQQVKTRWVALEEREKAYNFIRRQVERERQAFIICPLIEESEAIEAKAAVAEYERLSMEVFSDLRLGLLHGRMKGEEKDEVMRHFRDGKLDILVSTPVVEVGIDVPNATVMLVEGAERFGLAQLHQFRGRVGRGLYESYCLLLAEAPSLEGRERLAILEKVHDGFALAEEDLRLRGPGEFFGTRQSGLPDLKMASISDLPLLELAREEAHRLLEEDPALAASRHRPLARELNRVWRDSPIPAAEA